MNPELPANLLTAGALHSPVLFVVGLSLCPLLAGILFIIFREVEIIKDQQAYNSRLQQIKNSPSAQVLAARIRAHQEAINRGPSIFN